MPTEIITTFDDTETRRHGDAPTENPKSKIPNPKSQIIITGAGFYWRETDGVKVLICAPLEDAGFTNGFSTRNGGVSAFPENSLNLAGFDDDPAENIFENRRRLLKNFAGDWLITACWQVHGDEIRFVENLEIALDEKQKFDAMTANLQGVLLGVKTADCVPVLIGDAKTGAFAGVHAGWRGTSMSIVPKTIKKMRAIFGTNPKDLIVAVGPSASGKCYEVGADVIEIFRTNFPENYKHLLTPTRENHALIDIVQANCDQLLQYGVLPSNIFVAPFCTMTDSDLFFSYRADRKLYGKTGRSLSVIGRKT